MSGARKVISLVFLLTTVIFTALILYTIHVYFIVFRGVRSFSVLTPQLQVAVVNSSHISTTTNLTIQNPSELTFELRMIRMTLFLNGEYVLARTVSIPGFLQIEPNSSATFMVNGNVPSYKTAYVEEHVDGIWIVFVRLYLAAPLVNQFSWSNSWFVTRMAKMQMNAYESYVLTMRYKGGTWF